MIQKRFLLIAPTTACSSDTGGGQRTNLIFRALQQLGQVDVILVGNGDLQFFSKFFPSANSIQIIKISSSVDLTFWHFLRPIYPQIIDKIALVLEDRSLRYQPDQHLAATVKNLLANNDYNLIIGRYLSPTAKSGVLKQKEIPILLDYDDPDAQVLRARLNRSDLNFILRQIITWHLHQVESIVPPLLQSVQHIWVTNQNDQKSLERASVSVLPNIPYTFCSEAQITSINPESQTILFVGTYGHRVNREAIQQFILNHWLKIKAKVNNANLRIVGSGGWLSMQSTVGHIQGVELVGFVEDLSKEYAQSAFTIAPIFEGGGTKIKVVESFYYGRTAVVTSHAHYGYELFQDEQSLLVADSETEFVQKCIRLLNDFNLRVKLAQTAQSIVLEKYSFNHFQSVVNDTVMATAKEVS